MVFSKQTFTRSIGAALLTMLLFTLCVSYANGGTNTPPSANDGEGSSPIRKFETMDTNNDRFMNCSEAEQFPGLEAVFGGLDADKDGKLSAEEYGRFKALEVENVSGETPDLSIDKRP